MAKSMHMKMGESEKSHLYEISLAWREDTSQILKTRKAKEKYISGTNVSSYIMIFCIRKRTVLTIEKRKMRTFSIII